MEKPILGIVGLDAPAESTAIGFAEAGSAAPRFVSPVGPRWSELDKALTKPGRPESRRGRAR